MLGKRLRHLREINNITQDIVAKALGTSRQVYSNYELEKREPDSKMIICMANYFSVSTDYLLGISNEPSPSLIQDNSPDKVLKKASEDIIQSLISVEDFSVDEGEKLKDYIHLLKMARIQRHNAEIAGEGVISLNAKG